MIEHSTIWRDRFSSASPTWSRTHCRFEFGLLLEQGVGDYQFLFCTQLKQHAPVGVATQVSSHSYIKVARDDELVPTVLIAEEGPYVSVKGLFGRGVCHECGSVHADDGSLLASVFFKMKPTPERLRSSLLLPD